MKEEVETSPDERPLQALFTAKPHILIAGVLRIMRPAWVLPKPRFADKYIPDFLIGMMDSLGAGWMLIELESPTMTPINKDGSVSHGLHHAVQQIEDNRRWLAENALYYQKASGCDGIDAGCGATIVIGRRNHRAHELGAARIRDFRKNHIEVMSYDRLIENYEGQAARWLNQAKRVADLAGELRERQASENSA